MNLLTRSSVCRASASVPYGLSLSLNDQRGDEATMRLILICMSLCSCMAVRETFYSNSRFVKLKLIFLQLDALLRTKPVPSEDSLLTIKPKSNEDDDWDDWSSEEDIRYQS